MKTSIPSLSSLFVTWASAGQYGDIAELDHADEAVASKVHSLPVANRKKAIGGVQQFGNSAGEPKYIDGSMLVKRKIA